MVGGLKAAMVGYVQGYTCFNLKVGALSLPASVFGGSFFVLTQRPLRDENMMSNR